MYLERARNTIRTTIKSLQHLVGTIGDDFLKAVEMLYSAKGRVVVTGMGKSGIIGKKIAATLSSTGTPSFFMHPAEAVHGDLGMLVPEDIVLALSNSGETEEILELLNNLKLRGISLIAIVGKHDTTLGRHAEVTLVGEVVSEGCPIGCAPMASTTTFLVLGDAIASALMEKRGFKKEDFALFHPSGSLGRQLTTTVADRMVFDEACPFIAPHKNMGELIKVMMDFNQGAVIVADESRKLLGLITDGDIKRLLDRETENFFHLLVSDCMTRNPRTVGQTLMAEAALRIMENPSGSPISVIPVLDCDGLVVGLLRIHDIIRAKII
jgi:arabinose-5-phosphate isomerase